MNSMKFSGSLQAGQKASDPSNGSHGEFYYNTSSNKFRVYINGSWQDMVSSSVLSSTLASYVTSSSLTSTLSNYVTNSSLSSTLASYVTSSGLSTILADYVTNSSLSSTLASYAPLASPALTGVPTAPTAAANTNTTQLATTAFVTGAVSSASSLFATKALDNLASTAVNADIKPASDGTINLGSASLRYAKVWSVYVDSGALPLYLYGASVNVGNKQINLVAAPTSGTDAANKTYVDSAASSAQSAAEATAQFYADSTFIPLSQKGAASGVATLDGGGKVPASQLPNSVMEFQGFWDASANSPALANGSGNPGDVWEVSVAGSQNLGSGSITFAVGDWAVYANGVWHKSLNSNEVTSVNGMTGNVVVNAINQLTGDVTSSAASGSQSISTSIASSVIMGKLLSGYSVGSNSTLASTDSVIQAFGKLQGQINATVGAAITALTGDVVANGPGSASASIQAGVISNSHISTSAAIALSKLASLTASKILVSDGSGVISASAVASSQLSYLDATSSIQTQLDGKASKALDNLASTAVNVDLNPGSGEVSLGSVSSAWASVHAYQLLSPGNINIIANTGSSIINNAESFDVAANSFRLSDSNGSNFMVEKYKDSLSLAANTSSPTAISALAMDSSAFKSMIIDYTVQEATSLKQRVGRIFVATDGTIVTATEQYDETDMLGDSNGLQFSSSISAGIVSISYNNTHASNAAVMRCKVTLFRA